MQSSSGQTALVTGTSSGIGLSTALALAKAGFQVIATMRDLSKAQPLRVRAELEGVTLNIRQLDVSDETSITTTLNGIMQQHGQLDIVVNNAGVGYLGTTEQTPLADVKRVFEVNFFGIWRVTQAVLPLMRQARFGRIISVSSMGGVSGQPFNDAYNASKFALEGIPSCLAPVAQQFGMKPRHGWFTTSWQ
jgi:NAD(P)-dependent dehydrogenase (short-subunit alcohol dehydrogenase family)